MATYTKANLRNQVMYDLGVLDASEVPSAEDSVLVLARIQQEMERLAGDVYGLLPFDIDGDAIPAPYMVPLARVIAPSLALSFGRDVGTYEKIAELGMRELRRLKSKPHFGTVAQSDYF